MKFKSRCPHQVQDNRRVRPFGFSCEPDFGYGTIRIADGTDMKDQLINFRDFGGVPTAEGGHVRSDILYRCGKLCDLAPSALQRLIDLDFATIVDLRYVGERASEPSPWPPAYAARILCHDADVDDVAPHLGLIRDGTLTEELTDRLYCQLYRDLAFDEYYRPLFARVLRHIAETGGRTLIHCTAGKDRTGVMAALIQRVLGVPHDWIVADFVASARDPGLTALSRELAVRLERQHGFSDAECLALRLFGVEAHYLLAFFDEIESRCGSVEAYLDQTGFDASLREDLRRRLLVF